MNILGIETSCDETGAAVVENGEKVLSNVVASSLAEHQKFGGIIPEIASRRQMELIGTVVQEALAQAGLGLDDIDAFAVTRAPGLIGSLLVGLSYARAVGYATGRPLAEVDHIKAHLYANFLYPAGAAPRRPSLPAVGLIVSGGHTTLYEIRSHTDYRLLGQTRDDAAGEAFDKVARILGLGYPGGPVIDRLARAADPGPLRFPCARLPESFDFSFSGVKTAVLYHNKKHPSKAAANTAQVASAFQTSVVSVLVQKTIEACRAKKIKCLLVGGGVAANSQLRGELTAQAQANGIALHVPPLALCMDNAAMTAGYGYQQLKARRHA